jgi:TonB family protein
MEARGPENTMKSQKLILLVAIVLVLASLRAFAGEVKIVTNSNVTAETISAAEVKNIFLQEKRVLGDGTHVEPVLQKDGPTHQAFLREYLDRTAEDLRTYYRVLVFTGRGSVPKELSNDAEVVAYVAGRRGAIGYVSAEASTEGVKTLVIIHGGNSAQRELIIRVEPDYPETLKRLNIGGTVRLMVTIAPKGKVEKVEVLGGNPILGESATAAVKQWLYTASHSRTVMEVSIPFDSRR